MRVPFGQCLSIKNAKDKDCHTGDGDYWKIDLVEKAAPDLTKDINKRQKHSINQDKQVENPVLISNCTGLVQPSEIMQVELLLSVDLGYRFRSIKIE